MMNKNTVSIKYLQEIIDCISCSGFFACPGSEGNRIYHMKTCGNCAAIILLKRQIKKWRVKNETR